MKVKWYISSILAHDYVHISIIVIMEHNKLLVCTKTMAAMQLYKCIFCAITLMINNRGVVGYAKNYIGESE